MTDAAVQVGQVWVERSSRFTDRERREVTAVDVGRVQTRSVSYDGSCPRRWQNMLAFVRRFELVKTDD